VESSRSFAMSELENTSKKMMPKYRHVRTEVQHNSP